MSPGATTRPRSSRGHAPAVTIRPISGAVAAYAYGIPENNRLLRTSSTAMPLSLDDGYYAVTQRDTHSLSVPIRSLAGPTSPAVYETQRRRPRAHRIRHRRNAGHAQPR